MGAKKIAYVNSNMLHWARMQTPFDTIEKLHDYDDKIKTEDVEKWESGIDYPSISQAKLLAKYYKLPFAAFYLSAPPKNNIRKYTNRRTISGHPERELSISLWNEIQEFIAIRNSAVENLVDVEQNFPSLPIMDSTDSIEDIGRKVRDFLDYHPPFKNKSAYKNKPFNYFRKLFEDSGILVFQMKDIEINEARGISIYQDVLPIIGITAKDHDRAKVFSLFHELAHLILRTTESYCLVDFGENGDEEKHCDEIAAEILLPKNTFKEVAQDVYSKYGRWDDSSIEDISNRFGVSLLSVLRRLKDTGLMDTQDYWEKFHIMVGRYNYFKREKTETPPKIKYEYKYISRNGTLYPRIIMTAYAKGSLSYGEMCSTLNISPQNLRKLSAVLYK